MGYIKFFLSAFIAYLVVIVLSVPKIIPSEEGRYIITAFSLFLGFVALGIFSYKNKEVLNAYLKTSDSRLLMKVFFEKKESKKGNDSDA